MIQSIRIQNFQSHKDTQLDLAPGVNVIVGASDSGKTAIIRALRWLIWNRPSGESFRSHWGGDTSVAIDIDGQRIVRSRNSKDNAYMHARVKGDPRPFGVFSAVKTDVPEEILALLNMDETNLQSQFDAPFLLSSSPGEVAAYFNRIAHLDQIDVGLKYLARELRALESRKGFQEEEKSKLEEDLQIFDYLDKFEVDLESLEGLNQNREQKANQRNRIFQIVAQVSVNEEGIEENEWIIQLQEPVDSLLELYHKRHEHSKEFSSLRTHLSEIRQIDGALQRLGKQMAMAPMVDQALSFIEKRETIRQELSDLLEAVTEIEDVSNAINGFTIELSDYEKIFHENMPNICPLCNTDLSETH